ncbi:MAG: hypothetical protein H6737_15750 [Alphaproteobacteria bacterium]|nr:hypothetical protein [Alphaproteobacteria bacterium]
MILLLWACSSEPPPPPPPERPPPEVVKQEAIVAPPAPDASGDEPIGGGVPIELQFVGVGGLHRRWFGDVGIVTDLSRGLGACMKDRAVVILSYDEEENIGRIRLVLDGDQVTCKPVATGASVELSAVRPLGEALAAYRDTIAGRFDFRVASFRIELELLDGTNGCVLQLGGQYPPDGSTWNNCVDLGGEQKCVGPAREGTANMVFGDGEDARYLAKCFGARAR